MPAEKFFVHPNLPPLAPLPTPARLCGKAGFSDLASQKAFCRSLLQPSCYPLSAGHHWQLKILLESPLKHFLRNKQTFVLRHHNWAHRT